MLYINLTRFNKQCLQIFKIFLGSDYIYHIQSKLIRYGKATNTFYQMV